LPASDQAVIRKLAADTSKLGGGVINVDTMSVDSTHQQ
jgi:hypothetical protein